MCCLQEVRWIRLGARLLGVKERKISYGGQEKKMELVVLELW